MIRLLGVNGNDLSVNCREAESREADQGSNSLAAPDLLLFHRRAPLSVKTGVQ